jgi:hypothetical protein
MIPNNNDSNQRSSTSAAAAAVSTGSSLEEQSLAEGGPRIRFQTNRVGVCGDKSDNDDDDDLIWQPLAAALHMSEICGAAPVLPDGKIGGNGAILLLPPSTCNVYTWWQYV